MEAFNQLRKQARSKRDKAVNKARDEYAATLKRIGSNRTPRKPVASCVNSVLPMDRLFTTVDVMAALKASDPLRDWRKQPVVNHICKLGRRGILRRMKKAQRHEPAAYVFRGVEYEPLPFEGMTLAEVVLNVLAAHQPLRQADLVAAMLDAGYCTTMDLKRLRRAVSDKLRKDERFRVSGGEWDVVLLP